MSVYIHVDGASRCFMLVSVHIGVQTLRANPVRTLLSTLGVVMGAVALVGVRSLGDGAEAFARVPIERQGLQAIGINPHARATPSMGCWFLARPIRSSQSSTAERWRRH